MTTPSNHPDMLVQVHRHSTSGFANYNGYSAINPERSMTFDEPPPPYRNNSLPVNPFSDAFLQSALLSTASDRPLSVGPITPSPLTPVPLRHSSLYQVLRHDSPASPVQGTPQSGVSSIAHALEPQELQARTRTPVFGNARGSTIGASESTLSAGRTSLAVVAIDPCHPLPHGHTLAISPRAQSPVSSATPPCASQNGSVVTPLQSHTLVQSPPEVATQDYDTFPRLRKVSTPLPLLSICRIHTFTKELPPHSAPASVARILQRRPIYCIKPDLTSVIAPVIFDGRSGIILPRQQGCSRIGFQSAPLGAQAPRVAG
jgi:hypothetical protein